VRITKTAFAVLAFFITILVIVIIKKDSSVTYARTFCAYNRLFVEFEEGNKIWGTTMLDTRGRPIPCSESDTHEIVTQDNMSI
jgi:hypothetical protein